MFRQWQYRQWYYLTVYHNYLHMKGKGSLTKNGWFEDWYLVHRFRRGHSEVTTQKPRAWTISLFEPKCPFEKKLKEEHEEIWLAATTNLFGWTTQIHLRFRSNSLCKYPGLWSNAENGGSQHKVNWAGPAGKWNQLYVLWWRIFAIYSFQKSFNMTHISLLRLQ